jgi:outer membrane protein TolC
VLLSAQSLDEYLKIAEKDNPGLKAKYALFEASMQKVTQVRSLPDPQLNISALGRMIETRLGPAQASFALSQMFPWFGTLSAKGDVMTSMAEVELQRWYDARSEMFFDIKKVYYELYELENQIRLQEENRVILQSFKDLALSRFENGKGTMVDVLRVDVKMEDLKTEITILEANKKPLTVSFNLMLDRSVDEEIVIPELLEIENMDQELFSDSSFVHHPSLRTLDQQSRSLALQSELVKKDGLPSFGLGVNYTVIGKRTDVDFPDNGRDAIMPMFSISLPIYRKKYKAMAEEIHFMETSVQEMKKGLNNEFQARYEMAQFTKKKARERIELFQSQEENTERIVQLLLSAYSTSGSEFDQILDMQSLLIFYQSSTISAIKEHYTASAELAYLFSKD